METLSYKIDIQPEILLALDKSIDEFVADMQLYTAMQLFKNHKLSLGKAAMLAKMDKFVFMHFLSKNNIPVIDYSEDDLNEELKAFEEE